MTIPPQDASENSPPLMSLRVGVNTGNVALARPGLRKGTFEGVSIELAKAFADHVGLPLDYVVYPSAGKVVEGAKNGEWDIAFLAFDPSREDRLTFSPAYAFLEATFVVRKNAPYHSAAELDVEGVKLSVTENAAYELYLRNNFREAEMLHAATPGDALARFVKENLDAAAGIRQMLDDFCATNGEFRVLTDSFLSILQCIATRKHSPDVSSLVEGFMERLKHQGFPETMHEEARRTSIELRLLSTS